MLLNSTCKIFPPIFLYNKSSWGLVSLLYQLILSISVLFLSVTLAPLYPSNSMEVTWLTLDEGYLKLNVHCIQTEEPSAIGNINGVGVILRDSMGTKIWAALGPLQDMDEMQATLWAANAGIIQACKRDFHAIHMETVNREVYDAIRFQEFAFPPPNMEEALQQFNTMFNNHFIEEATSMRFSIIPPAMNATAEYMASYGLNNLTQFVEAPALFENLQYFLDRDMGLVLPMEIIPNFGLGEVENEPPLEASIDMADI